MPCVVTGWQPGVDGEATAAEAVRQARWRGAELVVVGPCDDLYETVVVEAERLCAELVVLGLPPRGHDVRTALLGDQAQLVMLDAPCPVLTVRTTSRASEPVAPEVTMEG